MPYFDEKSFTCKFISLLENAVTESIIFSPSCILNELTILYIGANGKTATEIQQIIGRDASKSEIIELLEESINRHKKTETGIQDCIVTYGNKVFHSESNRIDPRFCEILKTKLHGEIEQIDFSSKALVAKELNKFINKSTNNQISDSIKETGIPCNTDLVIISALHFIAPWQDNFDPRKMETFNSDPPREIEMMARYVMCQMNWNLIEDENWDCLGIPYLNCKAWMFIVLPKKEYSLSELIKNMTAESFDKWTQRKKSKRTKFYSLIPLINISTNLYLKETLKMMGIEALFTPGKCDLQNMTTRSGIIGEIVHTTFIKVDENGTEASSVATGYGIPVNANTFDFIADRPFLFFITTTDEKYIEMENDNTKPSNLLFVGTFC